MDEERPWWEEYSLCKGINKDGSRCRRYHRKAYERVPGDLVILVMCSIHADQEPSSDKTSVYEYERQYKNKGKRP